MYIDKDREIITNSTHNIPARLKQIDSDYFLVRNHATKQFEVHHWKQIGGTFCLNIPFNELDERTLQRVRETQIQYIDNIIAEMDRHNVELETKGDKELKEVTEVVTKDIFRYLNTHESKETIDANSKYFKEVV